MIDVVDAEDVTAIKRTGTLVILQIPWVAGIVLVLRGEIDFVRPRVIDFTAQAPAVLNAKSRLEAVVVSVGGVFHLVDVAESLDRCDKGRRWRDWLACCRPGKRRAPPLYLLLPSPCRQRMFMSVSTGKC